MNEELVAEYVRYRGHGGDEIQSYYARPLGPGPFPAVLVVHHMPGWDRESLETTRRIASEGYLAICPHLFHREGGEGVSPEDAAAAARAAGGVPDERFLGDASASISYLRSQAEASGKVGVIGYCSGGRQTYIAAAKLPIDAAVDCYGGRVIVPEDKLTERQPVAPLSLTPEISCPLLLLFGVEDSNPSDEDRQAIEAALRANGKTFESISYEGAGHGFFGVDHTSYRVDAALAGWSKILEFFDDFLSGSA